MAKKGWTIGIIVAIVLILLIGCGSVALAYIVMGAGRGATPLDKGKSVAIIKITGVIAASADSGLLTGTAGATPENIINQLRQADTDDRVASIVLRVDSPGGSAAASQEIYEEVKRVKKPVVVSVADIGASGAYYIACASDEIMASRASTVGSIGVIMQIADLQGLYEKLGIKFTTIKQGKYKDMGSGDRALTEEEKALLDTEAKEVYDQFIGDVAESREIPEATVRELATGQTWNGETALELELIDSLGNYRDAVLKAGKLGKIEGEPSIVRYDEVDLWSLLLGGSDTSGLTAVSRLLGLLDRAALPGSGAIAQ
jgi:protease-4